MHHAADTLEGLVYLQMCRRVARGAERSLHHVAVKVDDDHVLGAHDVVLHAAGLDHHKAAGAVYGADVAPCEYDQSVLYEIEIGAQNLLFELCQHRFPFIK